MESQEALKQLAIILQNPKMVNIPYTEGALVNACMASLQTALNELEELKSRESE